MGTPLPLDDGIAEAILRSEHFTAARASKVELVESSVRPTSSVYQIRVELEPEPRLYWVKVRPPGSLGTSRDEYRFLKEACGAFEGLGDLAVVTPVAYLGEFDALVTENIEGIPLNRLVKRSLNRLTARVTTIESIEVHFVRCGAWLAKLHTRALPGDDRFDLEILRRYIDVRLAHFEKRGAFDCQVRTRAMAYLDSLLQEMEPEALVRVWTHGDYAPYNVLVAEGGINVMDPDIGGYFAALGNYCSRYEDIVRFHRYTQSMSTSIGLISADIRTRLAASFLTGYAAAGGPVVREGSAAFRAFRLKYELLGAGNVRWPSRWARFTPERSRVKRFKRWLDQVVRE